MSKESKTWLSTFLAGFLATVLGIVLTFGLESLISSSKRTKTARLLAGYRPETGGGRYLLQDAECEGLFG